MKKALMLIPPALFSILLFSGCDSNYTVPTYTDTLQGIQTNVGHEFIIALDANPTTGYNWNEEYDDTLLELISKEYKPDEKAAGLTGAGGSQYYRFQAKHIGNVEVKFTYQRSWESAPIEKKIFNVDIAARLDREGGTMSTKEYQIDGFTKIEVSAAFEVEINQGEIYSVRVTSDDFRHVRVEKVGNTLQVGRQGIEWFAPFQQQPKAYITVPSLESVYFSGATKGTLNDIQTTSELSIKISGASNLEMTNVGVGGLNVELTGASTLKGSIKVIGDARLEVSGASKLELSGVVRDIKATISGASRAELYEFAAQNTGMEVSGASNAYVNLNGRLDAKVSGASTLAWTGNPIMGDINTSGASTLRRK
jgi:predicted secreted protein